MVRPQVTRKRRRTAVIVAAVAALLIPLFPISASAEDDTSLSDTLTVNWAEWLPAYIGPFDPSSSEECLAGRDSCIKKTLGEMGERARELAENCDHDAVFSLAYLRITQGYEWIRDTTDDDGSPHYEDKAWMNYVVETFARAYLWAFDEWHAGNPDVPLAWHIAFDAAAAREATGNGDLLVGINAHINRDLPFVMAASGLVRPDGTSGKPDYDKVNELLQLLTQPLAAELAARFDPDMDDGEESIADPTSFQLIVGWRERAWRNAEDLASASTAEERELIAARIEEDAAAEGALLLESNSYAPPLTTTKPRDDYCAEHHSDPPPEEYPFKIKW
ncbi:DUF5995 family protein [Haloechinothrix halophila]|uniref:DUF5995 family protein n=1 Tax=Haloechinothrix halophila TaxID=1069073 RepID=UPI000414A839|nr:DUF5995 family protein [Haloechinothrix halophila]